MLPGDGEKHKVLAAAYRASRYVLPQPNDPIICRIDQAQADMDALLARHSVAQACWLTADNPASRPCSQTRNQHHQQRLQQLLQQAPYPFFSGFAEAEHADWPQEHGFWILGHASSHRHHTGCEPGPAGPALACQQTDKPAMLDRTCEKA